MSAPWLKFYPTDWRADPALRMCSLAARGLWMEMLCIMHEAEPYGSLRVNGRAVTDRQLSALAGGDVGDLLIELEEAGVFSREDDGTIFSRRMQRDAEKAARDRANGKGGGNPSLKRGVNPPDKAQKPEARVQKIEGSDEPSSPEPAKASPVAVIGLPTVSDGDFPISESDVDEWQPAFPAVDVRQQLAVMRQWLIANPTKRKTKRGMRKFVVSWLDRKQNTGTTPSPRAASPPNRSPNVMDAYHEIARERGWTDEPDSVSSDNRDAQGLPGPGQRGTGTVVDLREGSDWFVGSGNR